MNSFSADGIETHFYSFSPRISSNKISFLADHDFSKNQNQNDEFYEKPNLPIKSRVPRTNDGALSLVKNIECRQTHSDQKDGNFGRYNFTNAKNSSDRKNLGTSSIPLAIKNERNKNEFCDYDEPIVPPKHVLDKSNLASIPENSLAIQNYTNYTKTKLTELL